MSKLFLVSLGPGRADLLTPAAKTAIQISSDLVGYGLYLDMLGELTQGELTQGKLLHDKPLGEEINRARHSLDLAAAGKTVSLISSGDIGIYAMATLVFELLDRQTKNQENSPQWLDVEIESIPGISAMQLLSSASGALLGHDFCTISLSDLLTPWSIIETRIHAAGQGDFVVSFYNPVSQRRNWQLNSARDILLQYRNHKTPVVLGRNLGRQQESITTTTLEYLNAKDVDMLTCVIVGNRETKIIRPPKHSKMGSKVYTPRGYAGKMQ